MRRLAAVLVGASLLALPACGQKTDESTRAAGITPVTAIGFLSVNLDPAIEQKRNLLSIARRFPDAREEVQGEFDEARDDLIAELLEDTGLEFGRDVKPWLGNEVAVAVLPSDGGDEPVVVALVETDDEAAAKAAIDKATAADEFEGAYLVIDDFVVITDEEDPAAEQAALAQISGQAGKDDGGLAEADEFTEVVDELAGDRLLLAWIDMKEALAVAGELGIDAIERFTDEASTLALDVHAENAAVVLQGVAAASGEGNGEVPELTRSLPAGTLAALTLFNVGKGVTEGIRAFTGEGGGGDFLADFEDATGLNLETDVLSWMRGELILVGGSIPEGQEFPDTALVVEPSDEAAARDGVAKIRQVLADQGFELEEREVAGTAAYVAAEPFTEGVQPAMALRADRFVLASNAEYLAQLLDEGAPTLAGTDAYESVLGDDSGDNTTMQFVALLDPIREALENLFLTDDEDRASYEEDVKPNLEPLAAFGIIARQDGRFNKVALKLTFD